MPIKVNHKRFFRPKYSWFLPIMILSGSMFLMNHCYYDSQEYLYPSLSCTDSISPTYSGAISSILNQYCLSCHGGSNPSGGVQLGTYSGVLEQVTNHHLLSSITQDGSVQAMPYSGGKLDDCEIEAFIKWINAGAKNN